jgi:hypothetical protein
MGESPMSLSATVHDDFEDDPEAAIIEFGSLDDEPAADSEEPAEPPEISRTIAFAEAGGGEHRRAAFDDDEDRHEEFSSIDFEASRAATEYAIRALTEAAGGCEGLAADTEVMMRLRPKPTEADENQLDSEIELIFDPPFGAEDAERHDLFAELFAEEESVVERFVMQGPDSFHERLHVASREGQAIARQLPAADSASSVAVIADPVAESNASGPSDEVPAEIEAVELDDSDMMVIEEDNHPDPNAPDGSVFAVRLGDYSQLFARLRRGGRVESSRQA